MDPITNIYFSVFHDCPLVNVNRPNGWTCDGRRQPDGCKTHPNGCANPIGSARKRFRCDKHDFDLCGPCMEYYKWPQMNTTDIHFQVSNILNSMQYDNIESVSKGNKFIKFHYYMYL